MRHSPSRRRTRSLTLPTIFGDHEDSGKGQMLCAASGLDYGDPSCRRPNCPVMWLPSNICSVGGEQFDLFNSRIWIIKKPTAGEPSLASHGGALSLSPHKYASQSRKSAGSTIGSGSFKNPNCFQWARRLLSAGLYLATSRMWDRNEDCFLHTFGPLWIRNPPHQAPFRINITDGYSQAGCKRR